MHFHYTGIRNFGRGAIRGVITAKKWWCQSASYDIQPEADKKLSTRGPITLFGFRLPVVSCTVVINARFPPILTDQFFWPISWGGRSPYTPPRGDTPTLVNWGPPPPGYHYRAFHSQYRAMHYSDSQLLARRLDYN